MKLKLKKTLIITHLIALTLSVLNVICKNVISFCLNDKIELTLELYTAISGFMLFFFFLKPFKSINLYFSIFALMATFGIIMLVFRSYFFSFLLIVIAYPIFPDQVKYEKDDIVITVPFQGFMNRCCYYEIKEKKLIFIKSYGIIESYNGPIDFETMKINSNKNEIQLIYKTNFDDKVFYKTKIKRVK
jgi:hypothetical protein